MRLDRAYWLMRAHPSLWLIAWQPGGFSYRCALCGRPGVEVELPA